MKYIWSQESGHVQIEQCFSIIDYGYERAQYYHRERSRGTLNCYYQHRVHDDPLVYPGLQDITAFVDFDACADAAEAYTFPMQRNPNEKSYYGNRSAAWGAAHALTALAWPRAASASSPSWSTAPSSDHSSASSALSSSRPPAPSLLPDATLSRPRRASRRR